MGLKNCYGSISKGYVIIDGNSSAGTICTISGCFGSEKSVSELYSSWGHEVSYF